MSKRADDTRTVEDARGSGYALLVSGASSVESIRLPPGESFVLGRAPGCDVVVNDESVSREHARLRFGARITLEDLGSKNGTHVQGRRLAPHAEEPVGVGSLFELGSVTVVVQRPQGIAPARATPAAPGKGDPILHDPTMLRLYALLGVIAKSPLAVLVLGETGVGKEVFAEALHAKSPRAKGPFVPIHCAALPESMLEAELFGYERGAFTGAMSAKPGLFEAAHEGTAFLDEIGEMPFATQAKLLRVLETGEVRRLGSVKAKRVDVRVVAATHRDLRALIGEDRFRADLYFRLNGISMTLPPLRERKADIVPLARELARRSAAALSKPAPSFAADAELLLGECAWPGNVRELRNVVERAVLLAARSEIVAADLKTAAPDTFASASAKAPPPAAAAGEGPEALRERLRDIECKQLEDALAKTGGNQSRAAALLGISRYALMHRMEVFGLVRPRKKR